MGLWLADLGGQRLCLLGRSGRAQGDVAGALCHLFTALPAVTLFRYIRACIMSKSFHSRQALVMVLASPAYDMLATLCPKV